MRRIAVGLLLVTTGNASVIGTNTPVKPLTEERVRAELPKGQQGPWLEYLKRSDAQMAADKAALAKEREGLTQIPPLPKQGFSGRSMRMREPAAFYKSEEARRTGDIIVSFQIPSGGWSKNLAFDAPRAKGQLYATANLAPTEAAPGDFDKPTDEKWHYIGTLDNDATNTELHFLAKLSAALPGHEGDAYRASALRGFEYLLRSQYPNGGWPQVWPLEGGYHDEVTFNDNAEIESAETLGMVARGEDQRPTHPGDEAAGMDGAPSDVAPEDYTFVPAAMRSRAKTAVAKALDCILKAQVKVNGQLTVWGQQYDPLTLEPASARNYEMPSLSSGESADAMAYLMSLPKPSPQVVRSVEAAAAWFEAHKIMGYTWSGGRDTPGGRSLKKVDGAGPLWSRYYSLTTGKPIFGDRDRTIHDDVMEISLERRNGYAWYGAGPMGALERYQEWRKGLGIRD
jgi:PelA/Pel-15E family pectate lyase